MPKQGRKPVSALRWVEALLGDPPGDPSDFIDHLEALNTKTLKVVFWCRVSGRQQQSHLDDQKATLHQAAGRLGIPVVGIFLVTNSGSDTGELRQAAEYAREFGAALLAESTSRFIRNESFTTTDHGPPPSATDLEKLQEAANGVCLVTLVHPDVSGREETGHQVKRGHLRSGRKGGRPRKNKPGYKKRRRNRLALSKIYWYSMAGWSLRRIAAEIGVSNSTLHDWVTKWLNGCPVFTDDNE